MVEHLDANKDVQNIDLMILADFCRNCLAKWYSAAASEQGADIDYDTKQDRHINVETKFIFTLLSQLMLASLCLACVKYTKFN
ncbi:hypothetical protein ALT717_260005 [Alteromonas macleodii]